MLKLYKLLPTLCLLISVMHVNAQSTLSTGEKEQVLINKRLEKYTRLEQDKKPQATCNPTDSNMNFGTGTLTGWNAYYATNNSTDSVYHINNITGGNCGSITGAANDSNTNTIKTTNPRDYQVSIMKGGNDPLVPSLTRTPPDGSGYSVRLGDSTNPNSGVAILSQTFPVTAANNAFIYQYAVLLEAPNHFIYENPYFSVLLSDQNNDTISLYGIYAGSVPPQGFTSFSYPVHNDRVYYNNWTTSIVSLNKYIGQCVTATFTIADCSESGHFGYGYINTSVGPLGINNVTNDSKVNVYPVPTNNLLNINTGSTYKPTMLSVYDVTGRKVLEKNVTQENNIETIDVSSLANGTYMLMLSDGKTTSQAKFTVMH